MITIVIKAHSFMKKITRYMNVNGVIYRVIGSC